MTAALDHTTRTLVPHLRATLKGRVITPDQDDYNESRKVFLGGPDRRPSAIVRAVDEEDVARTVVAARDTGTELAVRSGGHSMARHSTSGGGIVLDLRSLNSLDLDPDRRTASAGSGLSSGRYTFAAAEHGLATPFGDTGSVGIGGITLAGGIGYLVRKHALTIDSLLGAEVVTADGEIVRADSNEHPDLFWAIRGGGGNFGVATRLDFRLHDLPEIYGGLLILPASARLIERFLAYAESAPDELSMIANILPAPPLPLVSAENHGSLVLMATIVYAGPAEAGEIALAPFRSLAPVIVDLLGPMPYTGVFMGGGGGGPDQPLTAIETMFIDQIDANGAASIMEHLVTITAPMAVVQLRVLGGAMARIPDEATAFGHRKRRLMVNVSAIYDNPAEQAIHRDWVKSLAKSLDPADNAGAYPGFLGPEGIRGVQRAYPPATRARLAKIKTRYDPTNVFRLNANIRPRRGPSGGLQA